eukprot:3157800-Prorocentrum_lima.AAC.1
MDPYTGCKWCVDSRWVRAAGTSKFVCHGTNAGTFTAKGAVNSFRRGPHSQSAGGNEQRECAMEVR